MQTVNAPVGIDPAPIIRQLRSVVLRKPQLISDLGCAKLVPLENSWLLLVDPECIVAEKMPLPVLQSLKTDQMVVLVTRGHNIDVVAYALSCGDYSTGTATQVIDQLHQLQQRKAVGSHVSAEDMHERTKQDISSPRAETQAPPDRNESLASDGLSAYRCMMDGQIARLAEFPFDVLLLGETGCGKDVTARAIHAQSVRADKPFLCVPIASLCDSLIDSELFGHVRGAFSGAFEARPGKFEAASGGTVYIPEISNISFSMQLKLLYFMQYKKCLRVGEDPRHPERYCDVRLIMATNEDLEDCVKDGRMRMDFYYRIKGISLRIPPLREHPEDIPHLMRVFFERHGGRHKHRHIEPDALRWLMRQPWPGNIRQLEHLVRALVVTCTADSIGVDELQPYLRDGLEEPCPLGVIPQRPEQEDLTLHLGDPPLQYAEYTAGMQRRYLEAMLQKAQGSVSRAAQLSGLTPHGFRKAVERLRVPIPS